jgi:putative ABC transport system permease protein
MNNIFSSQWLRSFALQFRFAVEALSRSKKRTALSLIGVVIGVFAVFVVLSLGNAVRQFISGQIETFGADILQVEVKVPDTDKLSGGNTQGRTQVTTLTADDADAIAKLANVRAVYAGMIGQERAAYQEKNKRVFLFGVGPGAPDVDAGLDLEAGRFFAPEEDGASDKVVVLGSKVKTSLFGDRSDTEILGEKVTIGSERYRVIGIFAPRGAAGFFDLDSLVYLPISTLQKRIMGIKHVQMISIRMTDTTKEKTTIADIEALLRTRHEIRDVKKDDFSVTSTEEAKALVGTTLDALTWLLLALTAISLVVGGVGVMNVLYVSVAERTGEIGLRKAVGATQQAVLTQFMIEALLVTLIGGGLGILLGIGTTFAALAVAAHLGYTVTGVLTAETFLISILFAFLVGMVFGFAPALRASRLSPIEALRKD